MPRTAQDRRDPGDGRSRPQPVADQDSLVLGKVPRARTPRRQGSCIGGILQHRARDEDHRPAEPPASARTPVHPNCAARLGVAHPVEISRANSVHRPRRGAGTCVQFPSILDPLSPASAIGVATLAGIRLYIRSTVSRTVLPAPPSRFVERLDQPNSQLPRNHGVILSKNCSLCMTNDSRNKPVHSKKHHSKERENQQFPSKPPRRR